jgi:hypothetical protein
LIWRLLSQSAQPLLTCQVRRDEIIMPIVGGDFLAALISPNYFILLSAPAGYEGSATGHAALAGRQAQR